MDIAGLCNGSTADSDSVCEGSNPSPAAKIKCRNCCNFGTFSIVFATFGIKSSCAYAAVAYIVCASDKCVGMCYTELKHFAPEKIRIERFEYAGY